jgi:RNA polymerase sigma factor (sigma-70 family)
VTLAQPCAPSALGETGAVGSSRPVWSAELTQLYAGHHPWLHGWLCRRIGCTHQAADLTHDIFLRLLHAQQRGVADPAAWREPRAYLATVAGRLVANHFRRLSLERAWAEALAALPEAEARQALREMDAALATLSERARRAFLLSQLDGLTYAEVAAELSVTERSVKRYMAQAFAACLPAPR